MNHCPLCNHSKPSKYFEDKKRDYYLCPRCSLVFVPPQYHLNEIEEKGEYDLHENDPYDPGYRRFLSRLADPLLERVGEGKKGLDFGCGPGPALALILEEGGHKISLYDHYYHKDKSVLEDSFDFITATEVFEHLNDPAVEIESLFAILKRGGTLAIMTKLVKTPEAFKRWHYIQDPTHIIFFSKETFQFIASKYNCELLFIDRDVIFLEKR